MTPDRALQPAAAALIARQARLSADVQRTNDMKTRTRALLSALIGALLLLAAGVLMTLHRTYFAYSGGVTAMLASLPQGERQPPAAFERAVARVHPQGVASIVTMRLLGRLHSEPAGHLSGRYRALVWNTLLPRTRSPKDLLALYAHTMVWEGGQGFEAGAVHYFGKPANALTDRETLTLVLLDVNPSRYSPSKHPDALRMALKTYGW